MPDALVHVKLLVDEDLSPFAANRLRAEHGIDAVHVATMLAAVAAIRVEARKRRDMINRVLRISMEGLWRSKTCHQSRPRGERTRRVWESAGHGEAVAVHAPDAR